MNTFWVFMSRMNLIGWIVGAFVAHVVMYLLLGTDTWLSTSFLATAVWAVVLYALKVSGKKRMERHSAG
ncbi:hypothetical protein [Brevibacillus sp. SYSU BS000544]|uniref:hypothetical protein n=1 Tax=Brevibacillus sp. SYSU BS000544 TaxID=3416443 RepID=UPI003CE484CE